MPLFDKPCHLVSGGLGIGLAFGITCRYILRFMRYMNATIDQQVSLTLAFAYLSYYVANSPARVSGNPLLPGKTNFRGSSKPPLLANPILAGLHANAFP